MKINISEKNKEHTKIYNFFNVLLKRKILIFIFLIFLILASFFVGEYYGAYFYISGKAHITKRWIQTLKKNPISIIPNFFDGLSAKPEQITIDIKFKDFQELAFQRELALKYGNKYRLHPENKGYVKAEINYRGKKYKAKIRLKGGQVDHWGDEYKWSFKIKMKGKGRVLNMKNFSLQHPRTRSYINEWILHQLFKEENIIFLNYDFVELIVNGKNYGVYAIEENMDKILIEHNSLREGVILGFNTNLMWDKMAKLYDFGNAAQVRSYSKISGDSTLIKQFDTARTLLNLFRGGELGADKVFDLEKFAKFYAIIDLTGNHHATSIYNIKFYYNPVTSLLEPIGYDNGWYIKFAKNKNITGANIKIGYPDKTFSLNNYIFSNEQFYRLYIKHLKRLTKESYLNTFFEKIEKLFSQKISILHKTFPWYNYDGQYENIETLRFNQKYILNYLNSDKKVQVFYSGVSKNKDSVYLQVKNIFNLPIEVLSIKKHKKIISKNTDNIILNPLFVSENKYVKISFKIDTLEINSIKLNYHVLGDDSIFSESIIPWQPKIGYFIENDFIRQKPNFKSFNFLTVDDSAKTILIKPEKVTINENVIIPCGYKVLAGTGTKINLVNGAKILSYSPIFFIGKEDGLIKVYSSDSTGQGIMVMNAKTKSVLDFVSFNKLTNPHQLDWKLPSSVTFYESDVDISNCSFSNNNSEDAINIFRSSFNMNNTLFYNTKSDAFDCDFCNGYITNCNFIKPGNDGIDISGSNIVISNVKIENAGDKGLSAGENSIMKVSNTTCTNSEIAVASKDKSQVKLTNITIDNCKIGFTAFQKKPEFDFSSIFASNISISNTKIPFLIETKSKMTLDNKEIKSSKKNVKKILYGNQYGKSSK